MGVETNVYFGAYAEIKSLPSTQKIEIIRQCCGSKHGKDVIFCPKCGTKITDETITKEVEVGIYSVLEGILDSLYCIDVRSRLPKTGLKGPKSINILLPNRRGKSGKNIDLYDSSVSDIPTVDFVENFESEYSFEINYLKDKGVDIEIKSGIVVYYS